TATRPTPSSALSLHDALPIYERPVRADSELAAEHDVERVRRRAPRFVAELHAGQLLPAAGAGVVAVGHHLAEQAPEVDAPERERSEEHTSELQSLAYIVCRLL